MAKEKFTDRLLEGNINIKMDDEKGYWRADKSEVVAAIIQTCTQYLNRGDTLTLRQLYYQLVSKDIIPNHDKVYKKIGSIKDDLVYSGRIDWETFEDRGRQPITAYYENSVKGALQRTIDYYRLDRQKNQPVHIEVWTEKDAISGILRKITNPYSVSLIVNKGYSSSTAMYDAYNRFIDNINNGVPVCVLYFGDHDPSGLDMIRDIRERLEFMICKGDQLYDQDVQEWWEVQNFYGANECSDIMGIDNINDIEDTDKWCEVFEEAKRRLWLKDKEMIEIKHIGLTKEQIDLYNPPPNPAKIKDPRAKWYIEQHGPVSWEVDALTPDVMREIVKDEILQKMDSTIYDEIMAEEKHDKKSIITMINSLG